MKSLLLSHHPNCDTFKDDCYNIHGKRLCIGCFTAYPIAAIIVILWYLNTLHFPLYFYFLVGLSAGAFQILSLIGLTNTKAKKVVVKIALGVGYGFTVAGVFSIPINPTIQWLIFLNLFLLNGNLGYFRAKNMHKICDECEYEHSWATCPGFTGKDG